MDASRRPKRVGDPRTRFLVLTLCLVTAGGRRVAARETTPGSPMWEAGVHFGFATCSDTCCAALRAALDEEQRVGQLQWLTGPTSGTA